MEVMETMPRRRRSIQPASEPVATSATITVPRQGNWIEVEAPWNRDFVLAIKSKLVYPDRQWNPEKQRWLVKRDKQAQVEDLLRDYYEHVDTILA